MKGTRDHKKPGACERQKKSIITQMADGWIHDTKSFLKTNDNNENDTYNKKIMKTAGHDLDLDNLPLFAAIPQIAEVSIGHALISDALEQGLAAAVNAYHQILQA